ncbi:MAG: MBG domain-containing protein, partial [Limisphaerales bacterium]
TITFGALSNKTFGDPDFTVSATPSSGLTVSFAASGQCAISGNTVHITGVGSCTITASQAGDGNYNAAPNVDRSFTINKATATITLGSLSQTYDGTAKSATATTNPAGLKVTITYSQNGTPVASPTNAGSYDITATINDSNYQGSATGTLVISKATPVITWNNPADITYGTALGSTQLNATANVAGSFSYTPTAGTVLSAGNNQTLSTTFTPTDTANYNTTSKNVSINVLKANQTITFGALTNKTYGDAPFTVSATGGASGNAVTFSSQTPSVCSVSGNTVTILSAGACTIRASQAGNSNYNAAPDVDRPFNVAKADQIITVGTNAPASAAFNSQFTVGATLNSGLSVSYSSSGTCTNTGATFTMTSGTGTCTVKYDQAGNGNYNAAPQVTKSVTAQKANQTITFGALANQTFGDADFNVSATATSGLPVSFAASGNCTIIGSNQVHLTGAGSCTITASQAGNANFNAAPNVARSFNIDKVDQTVSLLPQNLPNRTFGDPDFTVTGGASSDLPVTFSATGNCTVTGNGLNSASVHLTGAGSCTITVTQPGNANYNPASTAQTFQINKANQTITFGALANKTFGDADFNVSATASSGLPVSFTATGNCTISGNTVHLTGVGSCTITASQPGNANFNAAPNVPQSFTISKANQTITFGAVANKTFGDADFNVSATASSGLPVNFAATGNCTVSGNTVHLTGAGSCTITASQAGDSNYNAAPSVPQSFTINKAATTTSLTSSVNPSNLGQSVTFTATVNPAPNTTTPTGAVQFKDGGVNVGAPVSLNASGVATLTTSGLTAGTHAITAEYSGNTNFNPSTGSLSQVVNNKPLLKFSQTSY